MVWFPLGMLETFHALPRCPEPTQPCINGNQSECSDSSAYQRSSKVLKIDRQCCFHWATPSHNILAFQDPLHHAQCIVHWPLHLVTVEVIGPSQNDWASCANLWAVQTRHPTLMCANETIALKNGLNKYTHLSKASCKCCRQWMKYMVTI